MIAAVAIANSEYCRIYTVMRTWGGLLCPAARVGGGVEELTMNETKEKSRLCPKESMYYPAFFQIDETKQEWSPPTSS